MNRVLGANTFHDFWNSPYCSGESLGKTWTGLQQVQHLPDCPHTLQELHEPSGPWCKVCEFEITSRLGKTSHPGIHYALQAYHVLTACQKNAGNYTKDQLLQDYRQLTSSTHALHQNTTGALWEKLRDDTRAYLPTLRGKLQGEEGNKAMSYFLMTQSGDNTPTLLQARVPRGARTSLESYLEACSLQNIAQGTYVCTLSLIPQFVANNYQKIYGKNVWVKLPCDLTPEMVETLGGIHQPDLRSIASNEMQLQASMQAARDLHL